MEPLTCESGTILEQLRVLPTWLLSLKQSRDRHAVGANASRRRHASGEEALEVVRDPQLCDPALDRSHTFEVDCHRPPSRRDNPHSDECVRGEIQRRESILDDPLNARALVNGEPITIAVRIGYFWFTEPSLG